MLKVKNIICITLCVVMCVALLAGCGGSNGGTSTGSTAANSTQAESQTASTGAAAPNFTDSVLELSFCTTNVTGTVTTPTQDAVTDELAKKTGVKWKSVEGLNGMDYNQRLNLAVSSGDFPDIFQIGAADADKFEKAGLTWSLKMEDLDKYAPEITKRFSANDKAIMISSDNTIKGFPSGMPTSDVDKQINPDYQAAIGDWLVGACDYVIFSARDDILNQIIPGTKTINDIYNIYKDKKTLTYDDVKIPGLETADDFISYLRKVKALGLKQDGKPVLPFALGNDNGNTMFTQEMGVPGLGMMEGFEGGTYCNAAWNPNDSQYELFYALPEYKAMLKKWNGVAREGLIDPNSVIMKPDQITEKVKSGIYAVVDYVDFNLKDMNAACDTFKRNYHYRPVYIPVKKTRYNPGFWPCSAGPSTYYVLNNKTIKESDLPKVMNFFNYFLTKEGSELVTWGPESAGLWAVGSDGKKHFKDPELEDDAVNWTNKEGTKTCSYYGLVEGGNWVGSANMDWRYYCYYNLFTSPYSPRVQAWPMPKTGSLDEFYGSKTNGIIYNLDSKTVSWQIDAFSTIYNMQVANNKDFADANTKFSVVNDLIPNLYPKILFSKTDADFEANYQKGLDRYKTEDGFDTLKVMADKAGKDYFAAHPELKPLDWPK